MIYYHSFWTKPLLRPDAQPDAQELFVWDFEALTWLLSVLEIRRHSEIRLITDSRGAAFARKAGFDWAYNGGVSTDLDRVPSNLDAQIFWAAGKLFAHQVMRPPCVCVDLDAVLWRPLQPASPVTVLHREDRNWPWYKADETQFKRFGFEQPCWDWTVDPVNAAMVAFSDSRLKELYVETAIGFMERYSREAGGCVSGRAESDALSSDPMVFAEQRLLPMCAAQLNESIGLLTEAYLPGVCIQRNPDCMHLWGSKVAYRVCRDARVAFVNHLIAIINSRFPEARSTIEGWKLDQQEPISPVVPEANKGSAIWKEGGLTFSLLRHVRGAVWIRDPNADVRRQAAEGSMVWSAEVIEPEPGASFELLVAGTQPLEFRQM
ncbi:MAG: hypothetical protein GX456_00215 [Verrucomicrobia bacterium]|nr:hypothetical protein [Verrucomicrobiota bacterium]